MIDPTTLDPATLRRPDLGDLLADDDWDVDEPLEFTDTAFAADDIAALAGVPISVDGCAFEACDLSLMTFVVVKHSHFSGCKLRGTSFRAPLQNVVVARCRLDECLFRMIRLRHVRFYDSELRDCEFYGSTLEQVTFDGGVFRGIGFDQCAIDGVNLTGVNELDISDPRTLTGVTIDETQVFGLAVRLAQLSGIDVQMLSVAAGGDDEGAIPPAGWNKAQG